MNTNIWLLPPPPQLSIFRRPLLQWHLTWLWMFYHFQNHFNDNRNLTYFSVTELHNKPLAMNEILKQNNWFWKEDRHIGSNRKQIFFLIGFFHSENKLKVLLHGPAGNRTPPPPGLRTPQPGPLHHRTNGWTATLFSFYLIGFFHSETNVKELAAQPGIDPRPLGFEHHSPNHYTTVAITESSCST